MTGQIAKFSNYPGGFSNGLTVRGVPLSIAHPGKVFFVGDSSTTALRGRRTPSDGNDGSFTKPFATIDYAVSQCSDNRGDIIYVLPGHTETVSTATSLVVDVEGIAIIGLGTGSDRPTLDFTATAGSLEIDAANTTLHNLRLLANVSAVVVGVNVDANYVTLDHLYFDWNETGDDFVIMVDIDGVDFATISNCEMRAEEGTTGCDHAIRLDDCDGVNIVDNHIKGSFTNAIVGEGAVGSDLLIARNYIYSAEDATANAIDINVAFTGLLAYNAIGTGEATTPEEAVDPGSLLSIENYVCNAVDESGTLVPTTAST